MSQGGLQSLIERNKAASKSWYPMPTIDELYSMGLQGGITVIVTCADARADPTMYLGLNPGEMPIFRNAGGRVTEDILTSLELLSAVVPLTTFIVVHHTHCGGLYVTDDDVRSKLAERSPSSASAIEHKSWNTYKTIGMEQSIRDDVSKLKSWRFLPEGSKIAGYIFDIKTGLLQEVE